MATKRNARSGFTLIELLVVISVIALLIGIILPAMGHAREVARRATCANNLHQYGVALVNYATSNGSYYPTVVNNFESDVYVGLSYLGSLPTGEYNALAPYMGWTSIAKPTSVQEAIDMKLPLLRCPNDPLASEAAASAYFVDWSSVYVWDPINGWTTDYFWCFGINYLPNPVDDHVGYPNLDGDKDTAYMASWGSSSTGQPDKAFQSPQRLDDPGALVLMADQAIQFPTAAGWQCPTVFNHGVNGGAAGPSFGTPLEAGCAGSNVLITDGSANWRKASNYSTTNGYIAESTMWAWAPFFYGGGAQSEYFYNAFW